MEGELDRSQGQRGEWAVTVPEKMRREIGAKLVALEALRQRRMKHGVGDSWPSFLTYS